MRIKHTNVRTVNGIRQANSTDSIQTANISSLVDTRAHSRPHLHWTRKKRGIESLPFVDHHGDARKQITLNLSHAAYLLNLAKRQSESR